MGPITLFDKSFLQSLSVNESVWFDKFFIPVICPIFYVETLANLAKVQTNRTADTEVRIIAEKTPVLFGGPCLFHTQLATMDLLGYDVPMDGRIPRPGARYVTGGGLTGFVYDESSEMKAFNRWKDEQFLEVERLFAAGWRRALEEANFNEIAEGLHKLGIDGKSCTSLEQAKIIAQAVVDDSRESFEQLEMVVRFFDIDEEHHSKLIERWRGLGQPALSTFAPYAAYVITVVIFFHISIAAKLISAERTSNLTDIAYLFYLPFCMMFVSNDKLHCRTAKLFLRPDQEFVWGFDLKADLNRLNIHYSTLPKKERDQGVMQIASHPPTEGEFFTTKLWRKWMSEAAFSERDHAEAMDPEKSRKLGEQFKAFTEGETLPDSQIPKADAGLQTMSIKRQVHRRKGSWYIAPKDLPDPVDE